jgi:uncharacterized membrane protein
VISPPDRRPTARTREHRPTGVPGNERISGFSDGVFSITITLLVFELHVPDLTQFIHNNPQASIDAELLREMWMLASTKGIVYFASFAVLGVYWVGQHNMFLHIKRHDRTMLWLNILFLAFVALMPYMASLLNAFGESPVAVIAYAGTLVLAGLSLDTIWRYSSTHHRLIEPHATPEFIAFVHRRVLQAPLIYLATIAIALISLLFSEGSAPRDDVLLVAKLLFVVAIALYIVPNPFDRHHHRQLAGPANEPASGTEPSRPHITEGHS